MAIHNSKNLFLALVYNNFSITACKPKLSENLVFGLFIGKIGDKKIYENILVDITPKNHRIKLCICRKNKLYCTYNYIFER